MIEKEKPKRQSRQKKAEPEGGNAEPVVEKEKPKRQSCQKKAEPEGGNTEPVVEKPKGKRVSNAGEKDAGVEEQLGAGARATMPKTWANRWIPSEEPALTRMMAIKKVFDEAIRHKIHRPSSAQSPFFTRCQRAFCDGGLNQESSYMDFVSLAELQVSDFLNSDCCSIFVTFEAAKFLCSQVIVNLLSHLLNFKLFFLGSR